MRGYHRKRKPAPGIIMFFAILPLVVTLVVYAAVSGTDPRDSVSGESPGITGTPAPTGEASQEPSASLPPEAPDNPTAEPTLPAAPAQTAEVLSYSFGDFLEESGPVEDDSFFDRAVFLGDSRTEGLQLYSGLRYGDFFWKRGMTVFRVDSKEWTFEIDGEELTMIEALGKKQYDSVYIMIGVNELGYPVSSYEQGLGEFIDQVIAAQPDAVVYLQTLPPVNDKAAQDNNLGSYINNENVNAFNEAVIRVAAEKKVVLLDTAEAYRGEDGQLPLDMTLDGCHFQYGKYSVWADYLRCHVMDPAQYRACREAAGLPGSAG